MTLEDTLRTARGCYNAGKDWSDIDFDLHQERIVEGVTKHDFLSYQAGDNWPDERFNPVAEKIAQSVAEDKESSYNAGVYWGGERFLPFAEDFARRVAKSPGRSYDAGNKWSDERFEQTWQTLVQGLDDKHREKARNNWPEIRKYVLQFTPETPNTYFQYHHSEKKSWVEIIGEVDTELFLNLQPSDFRTLAKAHELVKDKIEENATSFYNGLNQVLENGTVRQWAQQIIDHHQEPTIGGDTYRGVAV
jgi:hypothetical protein